MKFQQWCILDIMGHQRFAGLVTEETVAGAAFLRIDIPATGNQVAFTKLFSPSSVYSITPTTEELATAMAASINNAPIAVYDLPAEMQAKLRSPMPARLRGMDDDDDQMSDLSEPYDDSEPY
jgi:hypothetical protein